MSKNFIWLLLASLILTACQDHKGQVAESPTLSVDRIASLIKPQMRKGEVAELWAGDMVKNFGILGLPATQENVCAVTAVIEQESGFKADPEVANIRQILTKKIEKMEDNLLLSVALHTRMSQQAQNGKTFAQNMQNIRTEHDFEQWYNEFTEAKYTMIGLKSMKMDVSDLITTVGSMQVSVDYAQKKALLLRQPITHIRETLYTRAGGMLYGMSHLLNYPADYSKVYYRFADYNAGHYASRNSAFQKMVINLTQDKNMGQDGDLLSYVDGKAQPSKTHAALLTLIKKNNLPINSEALLKDLEKEKDFEFIHTQTYQLVSQLHRQKFGQVLLEQAPSIQLKSDKIARKLTTQWYADSVDRRYQNCLVRARSI